MAFSRLNIPAELVKVDDEVEVQVLSVDRENGTDLTRLKTTAGESLDNGS
jgi:ribosomal protein S1